MSQNHAFAPMLWLAAVLLGLLCSCESTDSTTGTSPHGAAPTLGDDVPRIQLVEFVLPSDSSTSAVKFSISKYEITNRQYQGFVQDTGYDGRDHPSSKRTEPFLHHFTDGRYPKGRAEYPVCYVNWWHAKAYCDWLAKKIGKTVRLPTAINWTPRVVSRRMRTL